jgi:hypothetical protein
MRVAQRAVKEAIGRHRPGRQPWHVADMAGGKGNFETIRRGVGKSVYAIGPEIVIFSLLAVGNYGRTCRFETLDGVPNSFLIERIQLRISVIS